MAPRLGWYLDGHRRENQWQGATAHQKSVRFPVAARQRIRPVSRDGEPTRARIHSQIPLRSQTEMPHPNWFIDSTLTAGVNRITGIPRVIRELVAASLGRYGDPEAVRLEPVGVRGERYRTCEFQQPRRATEARASRLLTVVHQSTDSFLREYAPRLQQAIVSGVMAIGGVPTWAIARTGEGTSDSPLRFHQGDVLILADATWVIPRWRNAVSAARADGARIIPVIYDLLPITHSEFFSRLFCVQFERWLTDMIPMSDALICISHSTAEELRLFATRQGQSHLLPPVGVFPLGATLAGGEDSPSESVAKVFQDHCCTFLMVGTIEPRKNHGQVLDAFQIAWAHGSNAQLVIIGRRGWQCDQIISRIKRLMQTGRRIAYIDNATDDDLRYAYRRAGCLIFSSFAEGFGLPIIEALALGLPVLASDIPVHREVGGRLVEYFPLGDTQRLAAVIQGVADGSILLSRNEAGVTHLTTWAESAAALASEIRKLLGDDSDPPTPRDHDPS